MTNTQRIIADFENAKSNGATSLNFYVGRYTGNGPSVLQSLRHRGYTVKRNPGGSYTMTA